MKKLVVPFLLTTVAACTAPSTETGRAPEHEASHSTTVDLTAATKAFLVARTDLTQLAAPEAALSPSRTRKDALGMSHVRFEQRERGVRVLGASVTAHYDVNGGLTTVDSHLVPHLERMSVTPVVDEAGARAEALRLFNERSERMGVVSRTPELVVLASTPGDPRLAYRVSVDAAGAFFGGVTFVLDASSGALLSAEDHDDDATEAAVKTTSKGLAGNAVALDATKYTDDRGAVSYRLKDITRPKAADGISTVNAENRTGLPFVMVQSASPSGFDPAAVDAHANGAAVYDFFDKHFGRKSIDGANGRIYSIVHVDVKLNNAFWNRESKVIIYGNGDGVLFDNFAEALDVAAHEFMHGVINTEAELPGDNEGGALNEGLADVFGVFVEHEVRPNDVDNWRMGESITKVGDCIRDISKGTTLRAGKQQPIPSHASQLLRLAAGAVSDPKNDKGYVHSNMGVITSAARLMIMGGTNDVSKISLAKHLAWDRAEALFYRAVTEYMQSADTMANFAKHTETAAKDLSFTAEEAAIVKCAWIATGLGTGACDPIATQETEEEKTEPAPATEAELPAPAASAPEAQEAPHPTSTQPQTGRLIGDASTAEGCSQSGAGGGTSETGLLLLASIVLGRRLARQRGRQAGSLR